MVVQPVARPVTWLVCPRACEIGGTTLHNWSHNHLWPGCDLLRFVIAGPELWTWFVLAATKFARTIIYDSYYQSRDLSAIYLRFVWFCGSNRVAIPVWLSLIFRQTYDRPATDLLPGHDCPCSRELWRPRLDRHMILKTDLRPICDHIPNRHDFAFEFAPWSGEYGGEPCRIVNLKTDWDTVKMDHAVALQALVHFKSCKASLLGNFIPIFSH